MPTLKSYTCIKCGANKEHGKISCDDCFRKHKDLITLRNEKFTHRLERINFNDDEVVDIFTKCKVNLNIIMLVKAINNYEQIFVILVNEIKNYITDVHNDNGLLSQDDIENKYDVIEDKIYSLEMPKSSYIPKHMVKKINDLYKMKLRKIFLIEALKIRNLELRDDSKVCDDYIIGGCSDEYTSCAICVDKMFEMKFMFKQTSYNKIMKNMMFQERSFGYIDSDTRILISDQSKDEALAKWSKNRPDDFDMTTITVDKVNIWPGNKLDTRFKYIKSPKYLNDDDSDD